MTAILEDQILAVTLILMVFAHAVLTVSLGLVMIPGGL
jgi:hypothetical protein